jgi:hypothetical protein
VASLLIGQNFKLFKKVLIKKLRQIKKEKVESKGHPKKYFVNSTYTGFFSLAENNLANSGCGVLTLSTQYNDILWVVEKLRDKTNGYDLAGSIMAEIRQPRLSLAQ